MIMQRAVMVGKARARRPDNVVGAEQGPAFAALHTGLIGDEVRGDIVGDCGIRIRHGIHTKAACSVGLVEVNVYLLALLARPLQRLLVVALPRNTAVAPHVDHRVLSSNCCNCVLWYCITPHWS